MRDLKSELLALGQPVRVDKGVTGDWTWEKWLEPDGTKTWKGWARKTFSSVSITNQVSTGIYRSTDGIAGCPLPAGVSASNVQRNLNTSSNSYDIRLGINDGLQATTSQTVNGVSILYAAIGTWTT